MKILLILYSLRRSWSSICLKNVRFIDVAAIPQGVKIELLPVPRKYSKHIWKGGIRHSRVSKGLSHDELYSAVIPNKNTECDIFSVETMGEIFVRICILDLWLLCHRHAILFAFVFFSEGFSRAGLMYSSASLPCSFLRHGPSRGTIARPVYIYLDIYSCANIYFAIPVTHQRTKASFNDQIVELAIMSGRDPRHGPPLWLPSGKHHLGRRRGRCMLRNGAGRCLPGKHKYLILVGKYWPDCASLPSFFNVFFYSKNTGDTLANWFEKF